MTEWTSNTRRGFFALIGGGVIAISAIFGGAGAAKALSGSQAESFVTSFVEQVRVLVENDKVGAEGAREFLTLLEKDAAVDDVAKFAMGRNWREMSAAQQSAYQEAFRGYISRTYQKRFGEYAGEDIKVTGSKDAGAKGVLVSSELIRPGDSSVALEWLVSDRNGKTVIADVIFEGVSLAITLRETFGGMVDKRNGDIDSFIKDLQSSAGA